MPRRNTNGHHNSIIFRFCETSTQTAMSQRSVIRQGDGTSGVGSTLDGDSATFTSPAATITHDKETSNENAERQLSHQQDDGKDVGGKPIRSVVGQPQNPRKIFGLDRKVNQYLLGDNTHPVYRYREDYLWRKLEEQVELGFVKRFDKDNEFHGYCYDDSVGRDHSNWNQWNLLCRPLVFQVDPNYFKFHRLTGERVTETPDYIELVGSCMPKFWNIDQDFSSDFIKNNTDPLSWEVTIKMDGSLGTIYYNDSAEEWEICTRGSFHSDQAKFAKWLLDGMDTSIFTVGHSYQVEIIQKYDKGHTVQYDWDGLVLIGGQDIAKGKEYSYADLQDLVDRQKGPPKYRLHLVKRLNNMSFDEIEKFLNDEDETLPLIEGVVFKYTLADGTGTHRFKWRSLRYLKAHDSQLRLGKKQIYKAYLNSEESVQNLKNSIPEDLHNHFDKTLGSYKNQIYTTLEKIKHQVNLIDDRHYSNLGEYFKTNTWGDAGEPFTVQDQALIYKVFDVGFSKFNRDWKQETETKKLNKDRVFLFKNVIRM